MACALYSPDLPAARRPAKRQAGAAEPAVSFASPWSLSIWKPEPSRLCQLSCQPGSLPLASSCHGRARRGDDVAAPSYRHRVLCYTLPLTRRGGRPAGRRLFPRHLDLPHRARAISSTCPPPQIVVFFSDHLDGGRGTPHGRPDSDLFF
nr:unnamed protein product [Digitaria exilis]